MEIYQISVFLENRAGKLSEVTRILAENNIDLRAISIAETSDYGVLRIIAKDSQHTVDVLKEHGFIASRTPVLAVGIEDKPGSLASLLEVLAEEKIDVEYMYSLFGVPTALATLILRVEKIDEARELLKKHGIHILDFNEYVSR